MSHQEAFRVIQRALIRSGINLVFSQGFNPHPKLSLPLPKSVGLASEDEMFCVQISETQGAEKEIYETIAAQLPQGFSLVDIAIHKGRINYQPVEAEYLIKLNENELNNVRLRISKLNGLIGAGEKIIIERTVDEEGNVKTVDVSKFIKSFKEAEQGVKTVCIISNSGTIRPDEIIKLLELQPARLGTSMIRNKVNWQIN